jgi:hypothetical protein
MCAYLHQLTEVNSACRRSPKLGTSDSWCLKAGSTLDKLPTLSGNTTPSVPKQKVFPRVSLRSAFVISLLTNWLFSIGTAENGYPAEGTYFPDNTKSKSILGIEYNSFENMMKDQMEQFLALEKQLGIN